MSEVPLNNLLIEIDQLIATACGPTQEPGHQAAAALPWNWTANARSKAVVGAQPLRGRPSRAPGALAGCVQGACGASVKSFIPARWSGHTTWRTGSQTKRRNMRCVEFAC